MSTGNPGAERASPAEQTNPKEKMYSVLRTPVHSPKTRRPPSRLAASLPSPGLEPRLWQ